MQRLHSEMCAPLPPTFSAFSSLTPCYDGETHSPVILASDYKPPPPQSTWFQTLFPVDSVLWSQHFNISLIKFRHLLLVLYIWMKFHQVITTSKYLLCFRFTFLALAITTWCTGIVLHFRYLFIYHSPILWVLLQPSSTWTPKQVSGREHQTRWEGRKRWRHCVEYITKPIIICCLHRWLQPSFNLYPGICDRLLPTRCLNKCLLTFDFSIWFCRGLSRFLLDFNLKPWPSKFHFIVLNCLKL